MYGRANVNSREARRFCAEHYLQRRISSRKLLTNHNQRLSESGSVACPCNADIVVLSQYPVKYRTHPNLSRHWFLDICWLGLVCIFEWVLCPLEAWIHFLTSYIYCGVFTPCKDCNLETRSRDYATVEESGVCRVVSVAPLPLLRSAEVNTSLVTRRQL
jgi:hypothetical protein